MEPVLRSANLKTNGRLYRAEVIKIEHPTRGDDTRAWGPPYAKHIRGDKTDSPGESAYFLSVRLLMQRSKESDFRTTVDEVIVGQSEQEICWTFFRLSGWRLNLA